MRRKEREGDNGWWRNRLLLSRNIVSTHYQGVEYLEG